MTALEKEAAAMSVFQAEGHDPAAAEGVTDKYTKLPEKQWAEWISALQTIYFFINEIPDSKRVV